MWQGGVPVVKDLNSGKCVMETKIKGDALHMVHVYYQFSIV